MVSIKDQVDFIMRGGTVERFHTRPLIHKQNNAEHQYGVASIAALIDPFLHKDALLFMLWHDIHEGQTGDIPYYSKLRWPGLKQVLNIAEAELNEQYQVLPELPDPSDKITLKIAEYMDVLIFCSKETYLGNTEFKTTIQECVELVIGLRDKYPPDQLGLSIVHSNINNLLHALMVEYETKTGQEWYSKMFKGKVLSTKSYAEQKEALGEETMSEYNDVYPR